MLDAFLATQPADVADEGRAIGQGGGDGEGVEVEEVTVGDEDFVAVGFEVPFGDEGGGVENDSVSKKIIDLRERHDNRCKRALLVIHH